jgi:hypothetical protein
MNKKTKKLNVYAKNFGFIINKKAIYPLSTLTNFLADNEWLKLSDEKYYDFGDKKIFDNKTLENKMTSLKPYNGSWFSKGSWLFHEINYEDDENMIHDKEIIYITVDYKNIFKINNKSPYSDLMSNDQYKSQLSKFNKKYIAKKPRNKLVPKGDKYSFCNFKSTKEMCNKKKTINSLPRFTNFKESRCKWNNKTKKCNYLPCTKKMNDCETIYDYPFYNWFKFLQKYDGIAIYPMMTLEEMEKIENHHGFSTWDVESLFLSNSTPIIHHHNLGTIRELLNISKDSDKEINYSKLVSKIIKKISEIRKTI